MSYYSRARSVSDLKAHLVLTTKSRRKVLTEEMLQDTKTSLNRVLSKWECELVEFNGESDYIHLLFRYHPSLQLSKLVNNLKTVSSRILRRDYSDKLAKVYGNKETLWNSSYLISSCGGVTVDVLRKYIENQGDSSHTN
jgi:putative transposase